MDIIYSPKPLVQSTVHETKFLQHIREIRILLLKHKYLPAQAPCTLKKQALLTLLLSKEVNAISDSFCGSRRGRNHGEMIYFRFDSYLNTTLLWLSDSRGINQPSFYDFYSFLILSIKRRLLEEG